MLTQLLRTTSSLCVPTLLPGPGPRPRTLPHLGRSFADVAVAESDAARLERRKGEWNVLTAPVPVRRLRSTPPREQWRDKLSRLGRDVSRVALTGGYVHELWLDQLSRDAQALGLAHHRFNVYALEQALLRPELVRRLRALGLSTEGDYVDLRQRLAQNSDLFK